MYSVNLVFISFEMMSEDVFHIRRRGHSVLPDFFHDLRYFMLGLSADINCSTKTDVHKRHERLLEVGYGHSFPSFSRLRGLGRYLYRLYDPLVEGRRIGVEDRRSVADGLAYQILVDNSFLCHAIPELQGSVFVDSPMPAPSANNSLLSFER